MEKADFTPNNIRDEVLDYIINRYYPHNELDSLGAKIYITGLSDIEVISVKESDSNFIVEGQGTLEMDSDVGDGETTPDSYPMKFTYEFDSGGKIVKQVFRDIDTSSFYDDFIVGLAYPYLDTFEHSILDITSLLGDTVGAARSCFHRLLYVNVITVLESYLQDFFTTQVKIDPKLLRKLIETTPTFKEQKFTLNTVYETMENINQRANNFLANLLWHRLDHVVPLYERVLGITFPVDTRNHLEQAILLRHDLVHRNGKKTDGTEHTISELNIRYAIKLVEELVRHIESEWIRLTPNSFGNPTSASMPVQGGK